MYLSVNQVEPDAEIRDNGPGSSQHEHVAAGLGAQGREQDADVRRGEQGGVPGTPGGFQVTESIRSKEEGRAERDHRATSWILIDFFFLLSALLPRDSISG